MIDSNYRQSFQRYFIDPVVNKILGSEITPNQITLLSLISGLLYFVFLSSHQILFSLIFLVLSGYLDILDGSLARARNTQNNSGAILDICSDRVVELLAVLGLYLYFPDNRALPCLFLLGSFYLCVTTFLVSGIFEQNNSQKSFHYSPGLIERSETFIFIFFVTLIPSSFILASYIFGCLVYFTAFRRLHQSIRNNS